jgi:asparagine synthetase B (glutamine-hydrolysing)
MPSFHRKFSKISSVKKEELILDSGIEIVISDSEILLEIPFAATDCIFYKKSQEGLEFSNDIRLLYQKGEELDSAGIGSVLFLSAIVPPLTTFKNIKTFIPGFKYKISLENFEILSKIPIEWTKPVERDYHLDEEEQILILSGLIDKQIRHFCPNEDPIVFFSGGVDSTVLATRVVAQNWDKASFVHYSFGENDLETKISNAIAKELNIKLDVINWNLSRGLECIENAVNLFRLPFADHGTVQMYDLFLGISEKYDSNRTVLDGTGADGAFGLFETSKHSKNLYYIPWFVRSMVSPLYKWLSFWKRSTSLEYYLRLIRRSAYLSELPNFVAHNPLINIGYFLNSGDITKISESCDEWIQSVAISTDLTETIPLIDIGLVCARIFAQKDKSLYANSPLRIAYPYMDHEVVDLAIHHARFWPGNSVPKNTLKKILTKVISPELVYRKKSGFLSPVMDTFSHPILINHLEYLANKDAPLHDYINQELLKSMIDYITKKKNLAFQTYNFLWATAFLNSWLQQLQEMPQVDSSIDFKINV